MREFCTSGSARVAARTDWSPLPQPRRGEERRCAAKGEHLARIIHLHLRSVTIRFERRVVRRSSLVNVPQHAFFAAVRRAPVFLAFRARSPTCK
jgi:hypothetical protein